ncbi:MAG: hypothetical protein KGM98_07850 [Bacteroidota bacterium]|nr:hypothetical protein [Bacteroidota bacterium]
MFSIITNILEPVSYFIYLTAFVYRYFYTRKTSHLLPVAYYFIASIMMTYASVLADRWMGNLFLYNYFLLPAGIIFFAGYFMDIFLKQYRKVVWILFTLNGLLFVFKIAFIPRQEVFDSIGFATLSISVLVFCFMYFRQLLNEVSEKPIFGNFNFWVVCSFFISYSGSFLVFLTYYYLTEKISTDYVDKTRHLLTVLWGIPNVLLFISGIFTLTGAIWTNYRRKS